MGFPILGRDFILVGCGRRPHDSIQIPHKEPALPKGAFFSRAGIRKEKAPRPLSAPAKTQSRPGARRREENERRGRGVPAPPRVQKTPWRAVS